jgi:phenylacetate-coenzyme A ligase PaaK-like adenylate-forming protein
MAELSKVQDEQVLKHVQHVKKAVSAYLATADIEKVHPAFEMHHHIVSHLQTQRLC